MENNVQVVCLILLLVNGIWCVCPPADPGEVIEYVIVPEENYDRNYSSISSEDKRPLGFEKAIWYYNKPDLNPCIKITGAKTRRLEVMFQTYPKTRLCVKDQSTAAQCSDQGTGQLYRCRQAPDDSVYLEFLCDNQCGESDVQFWYRLVLGILPADDPEDHWCDGRDQNEYPDSLQRLSDDFPIRTDSTTPSSGFRNSLSVGFLCFTMLLSSLVIVA